MWIYWSNYTLLPNVEFWFGCFLVKLSNILGTPFFRTLVMASISSIEKDSIATARDSFKVCILLACKIGNQMEAKSQERKIPQATTSCFAQK